MFWLSHSKITESLGYWPHCMLTVVYIAFISVLCFFFSESLIYLLPGRITALASCSLLLQIRCDMIFCLSVCLSVCVGCDRAWALQNGWIDRNAAWKLYSCKPKESCVVVREVGCSHWRHMANTIKHSAVPGTGRQRPSVYRPPAAQSTVTLTWELGFAPTLKIKGNYTAHCNPGLQWL